MSIRIMTYIWEHSQATGTALLLLLAIADNCNDEAEAWPSVPTLARKVRLTERQVQRLIAKLIQSGELEREERRIDLHRSKSNIYRVKSCMGDTHVTQWVAPMSPRRVTPMSPEPSLSEPSIEPLARRKNGAHPPDPRKDHPAIVSFRENAQSYPDKLAWDDIIGTVGDVPGDVSLWGQVVHAYALQGWNKRNIGNMLEFYRRGEIPAARNGKEKSNEPAGFAGIREARRRREESELTWGGGN